MIPLLEKWNEIESGIKESDSVVLLFDYDGTLVPIAEEPEKAVLSDDIRLKLRKLSSSKHVTIGIISGRSMADIKNKVGITHIVYAGNHGLEIEGPDLDFTYPLTQEIKSTIRVLNQVLKRMMSQIKGVFVEDKGLTLSVHYRLVEDEKRQTEAKHLFERIVGVPKILGRVHTKSGKKVLEVRPAIDWDKGRAIEHLLKYYKDRGICKGRIFLFYAGDDLTDEDAFKFVNKYDGISVYVGSPDNNSTANYYLGSTDEVKLVIEKMLELLEKK